MLKTRRSVCVSSMLLLCAGSLPALGDSGGENPQEIIIDFEGFPELTPISDQYASLGVTFELGGSIAMPIITTEGAPATAFGGYDGSFDTPFVSGIAGLTDPPGGSVIDSSDILIHFAKPASRVRIWVIDIDGGGSESWTDRCTVLATDDLDLVIDSVTLDANDPGTGDLAHTMFEVVAPEGSAGISKVAIDVTDNMGYAIDNVSFTLMPDIGGPGGGDDEPPAGGAGSGGTPGVIHVINPIGQESPEDLFVFGRAFITSKPSAGQMFAIVPFENGAFEVDASLLPCGVPVYWTIVGEGPLGNTVRFSSKSDPIIRRPVGDLTLDGTVDTADLGMMIQAYLSADPRGDLNRDGLVDTADLGVLLSVFGTTCHD